MQQQTERLGIAKLQDYFALSNWLFREQFTHDFGVDAQVEIVDDEYPTGKIIAIQIKSGNSYFSEKTATDYVYRTQDKHITYWTNHMLPVIIVLYSPKRDLLVWQKINKDTIVKTGKNWKVFVPKENILKAGNGALQMLSALTQPDSYIRKFNRLRLDKTWIEKVGRGELVKVQYDEWVNKSLRRYQLRILCNGKIQHWPFVYAPGMTIKGVLGHYLPWANFKMDNEGHSESARSDWDANCYVGRDSETGRKYYSQSFDEWYEKPSGIYPISSDGEIETYSLVLSLNKVGKAFLEIGNYLSHNDDLELKTFTLD